MKLPTKKTIFESLLIATGCLISLFSLSFDLLFQGSPGIGYHQLVGMTIGFIIILIGLRYVFLPGQPGWDLLLFVIYLSGVLFVGLRPNGSIGPYPASLLGMNTFSKRDFLLNFVGFIPLGFLIFPLIKYNISRSKTIMLVVVAAIIGFSASLVIETLQYFWIPGRYSSAYDLASNTLGVIIGAVCYLFLRSRQFILQKT